MGGSIGLEGLKEVEVFPGILRKTMSYNAEAMLCHFTMKKGARVPLHDHPAVQVDYVISGSVRFHFGDGSAGVMEAGSSCIVDSNQTHGLEVLEDAEAIEIFTPMRPEYAV